jgi:hypothetical protein
MGPEFYGLDKFISETSYNCITNNIALQSFISEYCGNYGILFILLRSRNISFNKFLNYFGVDSIENDLKIKNLINTFI